MQNLITKTRNNITNLTLLLFALVITSCSTSGIDGIEPPKINEKINLSINGDIVNQISLEADDLISYGISTDPYINNGEFEVNINFQDNSYLRLLIFNKYLTIPFDYEVPYPSYSHDLIKTRPAYVIADYFIDGKIEYSTVSTLVNGIEQTNVLEIQENESFYKFFLEDITLYNLTKEGHSTDVVDISFSGTVSFNI